MPIEHKYGRVTTERGTIDEDEPVVLFRAQDKLLPSVLKEYLALCTKNGSPPKHLRGIEETWRRVVKWQADHHTKVPD
jgi:hypothetical protein